MGARRAVPLVDTVLDSLNTNVQTYTTSAPSLSTTYTSADLNR